MKLETEREGRWLARRIGTRAALYGFAAVLTDALGVRRFCSARELAQIYEGHGARSTFPAWRSQKR